MSEEQPQNSKPSAPGRPFQKGKSGNPGGRPKSAGLVKEYAQKFTKEAVDELLRLMRNAENENVRKSAADSLLDRAIGRPVQAIAGADNGPLVVQILKYSEADLGDT